MHSTRGGISQMIESATTGQRRDDETYDDYGHVK